jgi:hypothetical protein
MDDLLNEFPPDFRRIAMLYDSWKPAERESFKDNLWRFFLREGKTEVAIMFYFDAKLWYQMICYVEKVSGVPKSEIMFQLRNKMSRSFSTSTITRWMRKIELYCGAAAKQPSKVQ